MGTASSAALVHCAAHLDIALAVHDKHYPGVVQPMRLLLLISLPACKGVPWTYCRTGAKLMHCTWERLDVAPSFTQLHCCGAPKWQPMSSCASHTILPPASQTS